MLIVIPLVFSVKYYQIIKLNKYGKKLLSINPMTDINNLFSIELKQRKCFHKYKICF